MKLVALTVLASIPAAIGLACIFKVNADFSKSRFRSRSARTLVHALPETNVKVNDVNSPWTNSFQVDMKNQQDTSSVSVTVPANDAIPSENEISWTESLRLVFDILAMEATAANVIGLCDNIDLIPAAGREAFVLRLGRWLLLTKMLKHSRKDYIDVVSFLINRIPRAELPNLQDIPYSDTNESREISAIISDGEIIADCKLQNVTYTGASLTLHSSCIE